MTAGRPGAGGKAGRAAAAGCAVLVCLVQVAIGLGLRLGAVQLSALAAGALVCGVLFALVALRLAAPPPAPAPEAGDLRALRHDLRGALTPIMLHAERLAGNAEPSVAQSGEQVLAAVDRINRRLSTLR